MHVRIPAMAALLGLACFLSSPASHAAPATAEGAVGAGARIESLIARMTVEEKAGQLSLYGPADTNIPGNPPAASPGCSTTKGSSASACCRRWPCANRAWAFRCCMAPT